MTTLDTTSRVAPPPPRSLDARIWLLMRYSGIALIPLAWIHVLIQDVLVGVHRIDLDYVALRWATLGWRVYDMALLGFAFAHGMNGLRQVLEDYVTHDRPRRLVRWGLFIAWLVITAIGTAAIVGGVGRGAGEAGGS
jgi:succinate dehydrogenase / fumarate reductase membrane anchor subunit